MSYPINYPTPQGANFQEFYGGGTTRDWVKPQGASMVRMLLIGAGGGGSNGTTVGGGVGGSSGAVTEWIGPAIFIPDVLRISVGAGGAPSSAGGNTTVIYQAKDGTGYTLLTANAGQGGGTAAVASTNNYFGAAGIFNSIGGQNGSATGTAITASTTTFLSGGSGGAVTTSGNAGAVGSKYGYPQLAGGIASGGNGQDGYFLFQPIMVGFGGTGGGGSTTTAGVGGRGGIGCGGGGGGRGGTGGAGGRGGDGAVFIWSW